MGWEQRSENYRPLPPNWKSIKRAVHKRDNYQCCTIFSNGLRCINSGDKCDHIIPRSQGGPDEMWNLQSLCEECHNKKTDRERGVGKKNRVTGPSWKKIPGVWQG